MDVIPTSKFFPREGVEGKVCCQSESFGQHFQIVEMNKESGHACKNTAYDSVLPDRVAKIFENHQRRDHAISASQRTRVKITTVQSP